MDMCCLLAKYFCQNNLKLVFRSNRQDAAVAARQLTGLATTTAPGDVAGGNARER
jgi:hypothetical protein